MKTFVSKKSLGFLAALLALACLGGCGDDAPTGDIISTVPASGTLTHQGKALEYYQVTVFPEGNRPAAGITDAEGKFVLGTNDTGDGAVAGMHPAAVVYVGPPVANPEEQQVPPPKVKIDKKYQDPKTSGLMVEIPESGTSDVKIDLK